MVNSHVHFMKKKFRGESVEGFFEGVGSGVISPEESGEEGTSPGEGISVEVTGSCGDNVTPGSGGTRFQFSPEFSATGADVSVSSA